MPLLFAGTQTHLTSKPLSLPLSSGSTCICNQEQSPPLGDITDQSHSTAPREQKLPSPATLNSKCSLVQTCCSVFTYTKPKAEDTCRAGSQHAGLVLQQKKGQFLFPIFTLPLARPAKPYFVNTELTLLSPASTRTLTCFLTSCTEQL